MYPRIIASVGNAPPQYDEWPIDDENSDEAETGEHDADCCHGHESSVWRHPLIDSLRQEIETLDRKWEAAPGDNRGSFDRLNELRSIRFAELTTRELANEQERTGTI